MSSDKIEVDFLMRCELCNKEIIKRVKRHRFCSPRCQIKSWRIKDYKLSPQKYYKHTIKWRINHREKYLELKRRCNKIDKQRNKHHYQIRHLTYNKYGLLPKGYEYHHTTEPYETNNFDILLQEEHRELHKKLRSDMKIISI